MQYKNMSKLSFLKDVFKCSISSFGGPEAHYGIFQSILIDQKKYISEDEFTELIGVYSLVPGPSSTQMITSIGYHVGGPKLAILTFLVWALPAMIVMSLFGVFFDFFTDVQVLNKLLTYLPQIAVGFIIFAGISLSKKVIKNQDQIWMFLIIFIISYLTIDVSFWIVPLILILSGIYTVIPHIKEHNNHQIRVKPKWYLLATLFGIALTNEILVQTLDISFITIFTSFYRYGYQVIGGGQIVIPLMIQDLVENQSLLTISDFLSGYAIDQAIPGPLFSFASFVSSRSFAHSSISFIYGVIGGLSIFLPGILLVLFIHPIWKRIREYKQPKFFLSGVKISAAALIMVTAVKQVVLLPVNYVGYLLIIISVLLLFLRKVPAPLIVLFAMIIGLFIN